MTSSYSRGSFPCFTGFTLLSFEFTQSLLYASVYPTQNYDDQTLSQLEAQPSRIEHKMDAYPESPPPYRENDPKLQQSNAALGQFQIARKPVSTPIAGPNSTKDKNGPSGPSFSSVEASRPNEVERELDEPGPHLPPRPELSLYTAVPTSITDSELYLSPLQTRTSTTTSSASTPGTSLSTNSSILTTTPSSASSQSSTSAYIQKAYKEARHFAGGLISHPYEHTKHYSILRHSHGLVFSQSPSSPMLHFQQTAQSGCKAKDGQARQECERKLSWDAMATG
jgi:hypothetical protein